MQNGIKKKAYEKRTVLWCSASFFLTIALIFCVYFIGSIAPFGNKTLAVMDGHIQYLDFFSYWRDVLTGKNSITYTFSNFLGGDTLSLISYYLLSPFNLLILLFEKHQIVMVFNILVALKLATAACTTAFYLQARFGHALKPMFLLTLSSGYALMQYSAEQASNIMWLDGVYMLPLILYGVYNTVRYKRITLLAISVALCIIFNWYVAGICCLFSIIWFFFELALEYKRINGKLNKEKIASLFLSLLHYGIGMAVGVMISAFLFLPTVYSLLGGKGSNAVFENTYLGNIASAAANSGIGASSDAGYPALYCGSVALIGCIAYFFSRKVSSFKKFCCGALLFFVIFTFYWKPLYMLFSLFRSNDSYWYRYGFIAVYAIVAIAAGFYSRFDQLKDALLPSAIAFSAYLMLCMYFAPRNNIKYVYFTVFVLLLSAFVMKVYGISANRGRMILAGVLVVVVSVELALNFKLVASDRYTISGEQTSTYQENQEFQIQQLLASDESNYRIAQTALRTSVAYNDSLAYGYASNTGYSSCVDNRQLQFLDRLGYRTEGECIQVVDTSIIAADSLLGVKYVLADTPIHGLIAQEQFQPLNGKQVYLNPYALPMAFTVKNYQLNQTDTKNPFVYQNNLYASLLGEEVQLYHAVPYTVNVQEDKEMKEKSVVYNLTLPNGNYALYGNIPWERPDSDAVLQINNDKQINYAQWVSPSVFYIPTDKQDRNAVVALKTEYAERFAEPQFYALDLDALQAVTDVLLANETKNIEFNGAKITCKTSARSGEYLFLSVPYSKGWTVWRNGEEITPELFGECMMLLPLTDGENNIQLSYHIPFFTVGMFISALGIVALVFVHLFSKNQKLMQKLIALLCSKDMRYIVIGACTTVFNLLIYTLLCKVVHLEVNLSNIISVICSIVFAYITNKRFVFQSKCSSCKALAAEFSKFVGARLVTMAIEVGGVYLLYSVLHQDELVAKLVTQVIVLVANYVISEFLVFKSRKEKNT